MNKFIKLAEIVKRNIVCDCYITNERTAKLIDYCRDNNINVGEMKKKHDFDSYVFAWGPTPFKDEQDILSVQYMCPLFSYFYFYRVSWKDFVSLANGTYEIKTPAEYGKILKEQDEPNNRNLEHQWNFLSRQPNIDLTCII